MNETHAELTAEIDPAAGEGVLEAGAMDVLTSELGRLKRIVAGMGLNASDAEDMLQDVSIRALKRSATSESRQACLHWLIKVTVNRCLMEHRSRKTFRRHAREILSRRRDMRGAAKAVVEKAIVAEERSVNDLKGAISEGVPEIVEAIIFNDNYYHQQLNLPNRGLIPNLPADAIVEVPGIISGHGIQGLNFPPLPEGIAELCRRELALSSLVVDAAVEGDRQLALQALLLDPMINDIGRARAILDDFVITFAEYLPQFA